MQVLCVVGDAAFVADLAADLADLKTIQRFRSVCVAFSTARWIAALTPSGEDPVISTPL
jgi:hypothetical protein